MLLSWRKGSAGKIENSQRAVKASDEDSSRCDHGNGNQYTYLLIVVEGMGKRNPHQVGKAEKIPKGFLSDIAKLALKMIDLYISRFTEKRRRTVRIHKGFFE